MEYHYLGASWGPNDNPRSFLWEVVLGFVVTKYRGVVDGGSAVAQPMADRWLMVDGPFGEGRAASSASRPYLGGPKRFKTFKAETGGFCCRRILFANRKKRAQFVTDAQDDANGSVSL